MSFPAYPSYKDSGIEWLGAIPTDWQVKKFRHTFRESDEKIEGEVVGPMLSVSGYRGIEVKDYDDENRRRSDEDLIGYRIVRPGQLVVNTMWLNYAGLGVSAHEGHVSPAYRAYRFIDENADGRFIHHLMRSSAYVLAYTQLLTGIRPNSLQMSRADLMDFPIVLPPQPAQRVIAAFLDRETAKIDALIEEQRRLIALLKEKRQAVISHAVSKGLDPHVPMKDSGIEWLGEVPAHWQVKPLKRVGVFNAGAGFPHEEQGVEGEELSFHKVNALGKAGSDGILPPSEDTITRDTAARLRAFVFPSGSIVFAKIGAALLLGRIRRINEPACLDNNMMGLVVSHHHDADFVRLLMTLVKFDLIANPGTVPSLNEGQIANAAFGFPPLREQQTIVEFLREQLARFDSLMAAAASSVELLNERRAALISAAVTGKIDVRKSISAEDREAA